jgi:hypothetical protein
MTANKKPFPWRLRSTFLFTFSPMYTTFSHPHAEPSSLSPAYRPFFYLASVPINLYASAPTTTSPDRFSPTFSFPLPFPAAPLPVEDGPEEGSPGVGPHSGTVCSHRCPNASRAVARLF